MGWVWRDDADDVNSSGCDISKYGSLNPSSDGGDRCSTRRIVKSQCRTEEVEPGKFVRKCEKTEEILRDCVGRPVEVVQSNKEYSEEDVSDQMVKGSFSSGSSENIPFNFPGLRSDIEAIEQDLLGGINRFFEAADGMKNDLFNIFSAPPHHYDQDSSCFPSMRRGIPIEGHPQEEVSPKQVKPKSGEFDLSGLTKDV